MLISYRNQEQSLGELLDFFGPIFVAQQLGNQMHYVYDARSLAHAPYLMKANVRRGRPLHHLDKSSGRVKKRFQHIMFRKQLYCELVLLCDECHTYVQVAAQIITEHAKQFIKYKHNMATVLQKYARRWLVQKEMQLALHIEQKGIDVEEDVITCEPINTPVVIACDWDAGNQYVYDYNTIINCVMYEKQPLYVYVNDAGDEHIVYEQRLHRNTAGLLLFKSPMTRKEFTMNEVRFIQHTLWYKLCKKNK